MITASREHEFCYGHRVVGHEGKCKNLHGHNGGVSFEIKSVHGILDDVGRIADFSVMKTKLCQWLEDNWDHKMLLWDKDSFKLTDVGEQVMGIVRVPFNPTAEEMAQYLLHVVGPEVLANIDPAVKLLSVTFYETSKCYVRADFR